VIYDGCLTMNFIGNRGVRTTKPLYGVFHGRFIEAMLTHFDDLFSSGTATARVRGHRRRGGSRGTNGTITLRGLTLQREFQRPAGCDRRGVVGASYELRANRLLNPCWLQRLFRGKRKFVGQLQTSPSGSFLGNPSASLESLYD
jgi:hypothetical protein